MLSRSLKAGLAGIARRPGLVALIYGANLALAYVLTLPLRTALAAVVGDTGFGTELAGGFDMVLWADILEEAGPLFGAVLAQLFWIVPLYFLWKTAAHVGLIHALRGDQIRPFWSGVGRYTGRAILLALLFVPLLIGWSVVTGIAGFVMGLLWPGEVGTFWTFWVVVPTLLITGLAVIDLMHDYARIALVVDEAGVVKAWSTGIRWPMRHGTASWLYLLWFVPAALLLLLPFWLDASFTAATTGAIWGLFLLQQVVLLLRAAMTVGWIGSEVALFERVRLREAPLLAEAHEAPAWPVEAAPQGDQATA